MTHALRHLLVFIAAGAALYLLKTRAWPFRESAQPIVQVGVAPSATRVEVEDAKREAVLAHEALQRGHALVDPIVRQELLRHMRRLYPSQAVDDATLIERAIGMKLPLHDPLVRRRLASQMEPVLLAGAKAPQVSDRSLAQYLKDHAQRYRIPARLSFFHVYRRIRGEDEKPPWAAIRASLGTGIPTIAQVRQASDHSLLPPRFEEARASQIDQRLGPGFFAKIHGERTGRWIGPVRSSFGAHLVYIARRLPPSLPALSEIRQRVASDYLHDAREQVLEAQVAALMQRYQFELRKPGDAP